LPALLFSIFYNIILTVALTLAVCCSYYLFLRRKHAMPIAMCAVFIAYLVDNTIVFCTEISPEFAVLYDEMFLNTPSVKTIYFIILIGSLLFCLHSVLPTFTIKHMIVLTCLHGALLICIPMISQNDWMVFLYYFTTQFFVIGISLWSLLALRKTSEPSGLSVLKEVLCYFMFMSILVLAEDSVVIFFVDQYEGPGLKIFNRNFSENLLYLGLATRITISAVRCLREQSDDILPSADQVSPQEPTLSEFEAFCSGYNLTDREQEILVYLLQSRSQQEISDKLMIALGTVKTHIHNIYQKTESSSRNQIIAKYQTFCSGEISQP